MTSNYSSGRLRRSLRRRPEVESRNRRSSNGSETMQRHNDKTTTRQNMKPESNGEPLCTKFRLREPFRRPISSSDFNILSKITLVLGVPRGLSKLHCSKQLGREK